MEWNITTRRRVIPESELPEVQQAAVDLLESLKRYLPDKCGEASAWNFEKAHSILHKVREIVLWGNTDNTSCQGAAWEDHSFAHGSGTGISATSAPTPSQTTMRMLVRKSKPHVFLNVIYLEPYITYNIAYDYVNT